MKISEIQSKLATWSMTEKERKFDRLLRLIADKTWLSEAAHITLASSGERTPGVDGAGIMPRWKVSGEHSKTSWFIISIIALGRRAFRRSPSTSRSSIIGNGSRLASATCRLLLSRGDIMKICSPLNPLDSTIANRPHSSAILRKLMPCFLNNAISTYTSSVIMAAQKAPIVSNRCISFQSALSVSIYIRR